MELIEMADELAQLAKSFTLKHNNTLKSVMDAASALHRSWSGSNLGYHAFVYYEDLRPRPPGAQFSTEWGLQDMSYTGMGSRGTWREYSPEAVKQNIYSKSGNPDLAHIENDSANIAQFVDDARDDLISELSIILKEGDDEFLKKLRSEAEKIKNTDPNSLARAMLPRGKLMSRDANAISGGLQVAPHQEVLARISALQAPADLAESLSRIARKAGSHMERRQKISQREQRVGTNVFIGHGRSALWRELKDFIVNRLHLPYEEFNRVPVAGVTNISRLSEMLDGAGCALIVLTAEDEQADGAIRARMNVIHEVGLFQGRLGFTKAIVLLEEGCEEFSNIQGLGQIRFPQGNISAAFEEVRAVLEREGMA
jgi:predicted nucleotide-binding protein